VYRKTRSLTEDSFVLDFAPSDLKTVERVRQWLADLPIDRPDGFAPACVVVGSDNSLGHVLVSPWLITHRLRKGFVDAMASSCGLDSADIRKRAWNDDWSKRPTRLVLNFSLVSASSDSPLPGFADLIDKLIDAVGELGAGTPELRFISTPFPRFDRATLQAIDVLAGGRGTDLQWRTPDFDVIAALEPGRQCGLVRLRLPRAVDPDQWVAGFVGVSRRLISSEVFGRPWSLSTVDWGEVLPGSQITVDSGAMLPVSQLTGPRIPSLRDWPLD
jgi:hypothetical protein